MSAVLSLSIASFLAATPQPADSSATGPRVARLIELFRPAATLTFGPATEIFDSPLQVNTDFSGFSAGVALEAQPDLPFSAGISVEGMHLTDRTPFTFSNHTVTERVRAAEIGVTAAARPCWRCRVNPFIGVAVGFQLNDVDTVEGVDIDEHGGIADPLWLFLGFDANLTEHLFARLTLTYYPRGAILYGESGPEPPAYMNFAALRGGVGYRF